MKKIYMILKKEMLALKRDKKALITLFIPILVYPILLIMFIGLSTLIQTNLQNKDLNLYIDNSIKHEVLNMIIEDGTINTIRVEGVDEIDFKSVGGFLREVDGKYILEYHSGYEYSNQLYRRVNRIFRNHNEEFKDLKLKEYGIEGEYNRIINISREDIGGEGEERMIAMVMGILIPFIVILYGIVGTYTLASDLSAGEKERGTLETIFSMPIRRFEIIVGKLLACTTIGIISGSINILGIFPLVYVIASNIPDVNVNISIFTILYLIIQILPIMLLCSTVFIGLGLIAKSYQESQSYGSFALIVLMIFTYIPMIPSLEGSLLVYSIPITNVSILSREAFLGEYLVMESIYAIFINLGLSLLLIGIMNKLFKSDKLIFGGGSA